MADDDDIGNYGKIGNAGGICSTGRSKGSVSTRPTAHYRGGSVFERKNRYEYESPWRERKEVRKQNKLDYKAGKNTPAVTMMRKNKIKIEKYNWGKDKPRETITDEWVLRKYPGGISKGLAPKIGRFHYKYVPPPEEKKKKKVID